MDCRLRPTLPRRLHIPPCDSAHGRSRHSPLHSDLDCVSHDAPNELGTAHGAETVRIFFLTLRERTCPTKVEITENHTFYRIVRIIIFAPFFAIFNFFSVWFYRKSWILEPIPEIYETFALIAMFYLLVVYVAPDVDDRESFFQHLQRIGRYSKKPKHNRGSLRWFQVSAPALRQICTERSTMLMKYISNYTGQLGHGIPNPPRELHPQSDLLDPLRRAMPARLHRLGRRNGHHRHRLGRHINLRPSHHHLRATHERFHQRPQSRVQALDLQGLCRARAHAGTRLQFPRRVPDLRSYQVHVCDGFCHRDPCVPDLRGDVPRLVALPVVLFGDGI